MLLLASKARDARRERPADCDACTCPEKVGWNNNSCIQGSRYINPLDDARTSNIVIEPSSHRIPLYSISYHERRTYLVVVEHLACLQTVLLPGYRYPRQRALRWKRLRLPPHVSVAHSPRLQTLSRHQLRVPTSRVQVRRALLNKDPWAGLRTWVHRHIGPMVACQ